MASTEIDREMTAEESAVIADAAVREGKNSSRYNVADLRNLRSFTDAVELVQATFGEDAVKDAAEEIGTGFTVLPTKDKARLVGVPFIILSVDFNEGDNGNFVSMMIMTRAGERLIVNDGSTGLYAQLDEWFVRSEHPGGLMVTGGLRRSDYEAEIDGKKQPATTYYLNV